MEERRPEITGPDALPPEDRSADLDLRDAAIGPCESAARAVDAPAMTAAGEFRSVESMQEVIDAARAELSACAASQAEAFKDREISVDLEIDDEGKVLGAQTEPREGLEGVPRVAACVRERAMDWSFAPQKNLGTMRLRIHFRFLGALADCADGAAHAN